MTASCQQTRLEAQERLFLEQQAALVASRAAAVSVQQQRPAGSGGSCHGAVIAVDPSALRERVLALVRAALQEVRSIVR